MSAPTSAVRIAAQLDPDTSRLLLRRVELRRKMRGWDRGQLAERASLHLPAGSRPLTAVVLNSWFSKRDRNVALRVEVDKALALLAAVDVASNRVDELLAELAYEVAALIDEAATAAQGVSA